MVNVDFRFSHVVVIVNSNFLMYFLALSLHLRPSKFIHGITLESWSYNVISRICCIIHFNKFQQLCMSCLLLYQRMLLLLESNVQYTCVPKENCIQMIALKSSFFFKKSLHMLNTHTDTASLFYFYDLM